MANISTQGFPHNTLYSDISKAAKSTYIFKPFSEAFGGFFSESLLTEYGQLEKKRWKIAGKIVNKKRNKCSGSFNSFSCKEVYVLQRQEII